MANIILDIETLPCDDPALLAEISAGIKPPKTHKKAETIAAWEDYEKPAAIAEAISRTGLDGTYGRICCIGWAIDDGPVDSIIGGEVDVIRHFLSVADASAVVEHYAAPVKTHTIIGHNVSNFDLRFLWQRAVIHGIQRPKSIPWNAKPWELQDTMLMWNPDREKRISLDRLCKVLGVKTSKGDLDGSKIAQAWLDGRLDEIATYCMADVEATRECWRKMR